MSMTEQIKSPMGELRNQLQRMQPQWAAALPKHIRPEHFERVVLTAIQGNPSLMTLDRRSLFQACTQAAQDGLLPDGREGAIVPFKGKAKWMPMVAGLLRKARNSGQIAAIVARVVYDGDKYRYWIDEDGEHLIYEPADNPDLAIVKRVFAMAKLTDGTLLVEPMSRGEIEKVRASSQTGQKEDGPWVQWWDEMAKKTAIRRLAKRLPMSPELEDVIRRDDELYDVAGKGRPMKVVEESFEGVPKESPAPLKSLDDFANGNHKQPDEPAKRGRGRPRKLEAEVKPDTWLEPYREAVANAKTPEEVQEAWDGIAEHIDLATEEQKSEASDIFNSKMDEFEDQASYQEP